MTNHRQLAGIVAGDVLDGAESVAAGNLDLPHVADVEEPGGGADRHVLLDEAGVLDRHVPAAELDHASAQRSMAGVQGRLLQCSGCRLGHWVW